MTELELSTLKVKSRAYDNVIELQERWRREKDEAIAARNRAMDVVEVSSHLLGEFLAELESVANPDECKACRSIVESANILARCHCGKCHDCRVLLQRP